MEDVDSPTARALRTLELMQHHPGITAGALAERLGVTDRAARRYVAMLREAGISVESTPGRYGGYRLGRGVRLPPLVFSGVEALGLVMAVLDGRHAAADPDDVVGSALGKLIRALPRDVARQAAVMREHARAAGRDEVVRPDPDIAGRLVDAVADRRLVRVDYRTAAGTTTTQRVEPWAVVVRHARWYLLCRVVDRAVTRAYRIDRILTLAGLDERFVPPDDLDPVARLEEHLGADWEHPTRVRFAADAAEVTPYLTPMMGRLVPDPAGGCVLYGSTSNPQMYAAEWLAALPFAFVIEDGPELRAAMAELVGRLSGSVGRGSSVR